VAYLTIWSYCWAMSSQRIGRVSAGSRCAAHGLVGLLERRLGEPEQDALLAAHPAQVGHQLALDAPLGARVDPVHQRDQQLDQAVGDLRRAGVAQRGQQREPHRPGPGAQVGRVLGRGSRPPGRHELLGRVVEQVGGKAERSHALELVDLAK
jgi:hypothetical protein